ncbi:tetratricopeptide repeat protein [Saccharomonospora azurea]|uniref:tetratricopeptide repeat protein n=1 Tax=Saccharomonospora azurea TaxID=40988 RepID=UPI003D8F4BB8
MGILRRRRSRKQHDESEPTEITITLDALTSASLHMNATIRRHGEDHPESIEAMRIVAYHLARDPRRQQDAAALLHHVAGSTYANLGPDHPDTLTAVYEAGDLQCAVGNLELAEQMLREALAGRERVLGRDHPDTLLAAQALGVVLTGLGRPAEAQALHDDVAERRERSLGAGHESTLISRGKRADALRSAGRFEEAAALFREIVADTDRAYGPDSWKATVARNNLAATEFQLGHAEAAADLFRDVLRAATRLPEREGFAARVRSNLATVLFGMERYREAGVLLRDSVAECERVFGPDHPETIQSVANLARVLAVEGDRSTAAELTRRCLAHYEARLPPTHPRLTELREFLDDLEPC